MLMPFPMVPPGAHSISTYLYARGADSQSLAQYSASLQAIADQYSRPYKRWEAEFVA